MKKVFQYSLFVIGILSLYIFLPTKPNKVDLDVLKVTQQEYNLESKYSILIDYKKSVLKKRLWLIDNTNNEVILNCHVSHAKNSGLLWASKFSNVSGSELSCVGAFKTQGSYESNYGKGKYKIGMRLQGLEKDKNDNCFKRNIVFHTSFPVYSKGCFMTSAKNNKFIIDKTKNGSLVFVLR